MVEEVVSEAEAVWGSAAGLEEGSAGDEEPAPRLAARIGRRYIVVGQRLGSPQRHLFTAADSLGEARFFAAWARRLLDRLAFAAADVMGVDALWEVQVYDLQPGG